MKNKTYACLLSALLLYSAEGYSAQGDISGFLIGELTRIRDDIVFKYCDYSIPITLINYTSGNEQGIYKMDVYNGRSEKIGEQEIRWFNLISTGGPPSFNRTAAPNPDIKYTDRKMSFSGDATTEFLLFTTN